MTTYFGQCTSAGATVGASSNSDFGIIWWRAYTFPHSGQATLADVGISCFYTGVGATVRLAIYDSTGTTLIAESSLGATTLAEAWQNMTITATLTGGVTYIIAATGSASPGIQTNFGGPDTCSYKLTDYTAGFPAALPVQDGTGTVLYNMRVGFNAPTITAEPADATAYNGETVNFSVSATASAGSLTYQWQVSTDGCVTFSNVSSGSGATSANYTTGVLAFSDDKTFYRCLVTDDNNTTNSRAAAVRITPRATGAWVRT